MKTLLTTLALIATTTSAFAGSFQADALVIGSSVYTSEAGYSSTTSYDLHGDANEYLQCVDDAIDDLEERQDIYGGKIKEYKETRKKDFRQTVIKLTYPSGNERVVTCSWFID